MSKRASTQRETKTERMRHTARMRKTTTAKTPNMDNKPPKPATTPPTKAHINRTATYTTKPTANHFTHFLMPVGAEASFQILLYFSSLFHNIDFFFMPCRWLHLARFRGQIRTGRKYARLLVKNFQPPRWTD